MASTLIVVACGQRKIWDEHTVHGPVAASEAYIGAPFRLNRAYAERFGDGWLILSAKYGFISPEFPVPGPYNVTFKRVKTGPIALDTLREQVRLFDLARYTHAVVLGGADYRHAVQHAFARTRTALSFPTAGLGIGKAMQAIRRALDTDVQLAPNGS